MRSRILALLLDEPAVATNTSERRRMGQSSAALVRRHDGTMAVLPLENIAEAKALSPDSGLFRRARPIIDPDSEEVIGYEMEEVLAR